ncbi:unnamed protein product [Chilo suppressalis]|uniref:1-acyl-sn-glycerol-3-phosphate acyltransferase n=1 Tax=Chilo suppressalis TaxID=168631 RepID=A0ABN8BEY0_CHISP|nr:unnamed protein product [Chilo suppressalis]
MWEKLFMIFACALTFLIRKIIQKEHNIYKFNFKFVLYYFYSSVCAFFVWPFFLFNPKSVHNARFGAWLIRPITTFFEIDWILRNGEILAEERGAIIVSNHQSSFDILGLFNIWHVVYKMTVVAKNELFYIWPFGLSAYLAGVVFIKRSDAKGAYRHLDIISNVLLKDKTKIWVFPEGTRNKDYNKMLPFKKGAFTMAVVAQVPIIPVVFSPYYFINKEKHFFDKGHIIIQCLEPISTKGLSLEDIPDLMDKVQQKMMVTYKELSKEVLDSLPTNYTLTENGRNLQNVKELAGIYEYLGQRVLGIQLTVRNSKVLLEDKPAVIVVNHQSSLEILLIFQIWRKLIRRIIGVSKSELLYLFPYGQTNYLLGTMFVNRKKGGLDDMERIGREVVREKARAFMMPEGTRNHNKETLLPFKRGAFHMAIKSQIPIIPIAISPFYFIDYEKTSFGQRGLKEITLL